MGPYDGSPISFIEDQTTKELQILLLMSKSGQKLNFCLVCSPGLLLVVLSIHQKADCATILVEAIP